MLTDIRMPPTQSDEGIRLAARLRAERPEIGVVVLSQGERAGPRSRHATRTLTAAKIRTVRISRSGRTKSSTNAGSLLTTMNALPGHPSLQSAHWVGTG